jgi:polar amino acid transport system substrate-binding protein
MRLLRLPLPAKELAAMRLLHLFLPALLMLSQLACQSSLTGSGGDSSSAPMRLQRILDSGELRVGLSGNQPPLNMTDKNGEIIGLEVDLMKALAQSMGLTTRFVVKPFADLIPAIERGEVDVVISGMTITPERNARVAFAGPYFISGKSVLTKSPTIASADNATLLNNADQRYAVLAGSTSETFVGQALTKAVSVPATDYDTAVQMVLDDEVDAMIADFPICQLSVMRHPEAGLSTLMTPFTIEPLGIALPADDPLLVNLIENYLNTLENTGLLVQFKAKWFSDGSWISELP